MKAKWFLPVLGTAILIAATACFRSTQDTAPSEALIGSWELTPESRESFRAACMVLDFPPPGQASFEIIAHAGHLVLRLNDPGHTSWRSPIGRRGFAASQILPTTPAGAVFGREMVVRVSLAVPTGNSDILHMHWSTPDFKACGSFTTTAMRK